MRKLNYLFLGVLLAFLFMGCQSYKKVPYMQNAAQVNKIEQKSKSEEVKVMPKDLLTIVVSCSTPELAVPFNLGGEVSGENLDAKGLGRTSSSFRQYLVDNQGNVNFPVVGEIHVGGLSKLEIESLIVGKLKVYLKEDPIVTVRIVNYRISVLGEVTSPGSFTVSREKINLLEALAMAGDLTIYGMRNNVKLIRTNKDNKQEIITLDLNKAETVFSPYYQLQQNDIIYVTPNKARAKNSDIGTSTGLWFSATSILVSLASLLFNIIR